MKRKILCLLWFAIPLLSMAQSQVQYEYDASGNRVKRQVVIPLPAPPAPQDSMETKMPASNELETVHFQNVEATELYSVEKIAQTEIKIYPNPTTEKITLEISTWKDLQMGIFKLFSLNGQLLQEQPVHSATTTVSLSGLPAGTYILKVNINNRTEDWKIVKQ